jgi:hypothetical protein
MAWIKINHSLLYEGPREVAEALLEICRDVLGETEAPAPLRYNLDDPDPGQPRGILASLIEKDARTDLLERCKQYLQESFAQPGPSARSLHPKLRHYGSGSSTPSPLPPPSVVKALTAASGTTDFEQARRMWFVDMASTIEEGHPDFDKSCDLCGEKHAMRTNYFIRRTDAPERVLRVGSTCVQRFIILPGTSTQEESADAFLRMERLRATGIRLAPVLQRIFSGERVAEDRAADLLALSHSLKLGTLSVRDLRTILECTGLPAEQVEQALRMLMDPSILRNHRSRIVKTKAKEKVRSRVRRVMLAGIGRSRSRL